MNKIKITIILIIGIHFWGYSQWEEKNISTNWSLSSVDFVTDKIGFVTGANKIYKTINGGNDWMISHTANDLIVFEDIFAIDNNKIIGIGKDLNSNQSVIIKTENGGIDWNNAIVSNSSFLKSVYFVTSEIGFCSGGDGTILKSIDSGNTWQELISGTKINLESIFFINEMVGITVGGYPGLAIILKTQDGGKNWNPIKSPSNNNLQSVYFSNQETAYIVGWNGEIMITNNCGVDWTIQNSVAMTGNLEVIFIDDNTGYIVGGSMNESLIQKTTNGGKLWQDISPKLSKGMQCIDFPTFNVGYAVGENGTVVKTETGGVISSTNSFEISNAFKVFPNPTNGTLNIKSENNELINKVIIYNSNGTVLNELTSFSPISEIDLSNLESNVYYAVIQSHNKTEIKKIIKK
jgi:photosystem II stability/assembly factor-like uncharacterized protein